MKQLVSLLCCLCIATMAPTYATDLMHQLFTFYEAHNYAKALAVADTLVHNDPDNPELLCNKALIEKKLGHHDQAITTYTQVLAHNPTHARAHRGIAHAYLMQGDFAQGLPSYEYRWVNPPAYVQDCKQYLEQHPDLSTTSILIKTEYGLGDTLQFIRYAQLLKQKGATIIVESQPALVPLLRLCPYIDKVVAAGEPLPQTDCTTLLMSLPYILNTTLETIPNHTPYLYADQKLITEWNKRVASTSHKHPIRKIGICWQGDMHPNSTNSTVQNDAREKSIPLANLLAITQGTYSQLYSLQKGDGLAQLPPDHPELTVFDDLDTKDAFMDSAALIKAMDLIITVDTSIAHLAGGLGVPVWLLLPHNADWRWLLNRNDSPWYPTMRLFRQPAPGDWLSVIEAVRHTLIMENQLYPITELFSYALEHIKTERLAYAIEAFERINQRAAQLTDVVYNLGYLLNLNNEPTKALTYYDEVLRRDPEHSNAHLGRGKCLLKTGLCKEGWQELEWRWPNVHECRAQFNHYALTPDTVAGKRILIRAEWGLGDIMQFIRYAQLLHQHGATVLVQTPQPLIALFSLCDYIDTVVPVGDPLPPHDAQVPIMSLPIIFDTHLNSIPNTTPYLYADPTLEDEWRSKLADDPNFKIGLCWQAKKIFLEDHPFTRRSVPLELFQPLSELKGVSLYSLQCGDGSEQVTQQSFTIHEFGPNFDKDHGAFMDTAAVMKNLDLVISVDTSPIHLASALNVPTWVLLPFSNEWRWLEQRTDTPWYQTIRLFRQPTPNSWPSVIATITQEVTDLIQKQRTAHANKPQ